MVLHQGASHAGWWVGAALPGHHGPQARRSGAGRQALRLQLLGEAAGVLLNADAPDAMLQRLFTKIALPLQLEVYFNFTVDGDSLRLASYSGIAPETAAARTTLAYGQGVCGRVALQRQAITVQDIQHSDDPAVEPERSMGVQAYTCNPLMAGETLLGTLSFGRRSNTTFGADDLEFLQTICHYAAAAFERIGLIQRLRDAARRKDEFLALLAHELRNPLAPVRNAVKILGLKGTDAPELLCARDVIDRQVQHMSRLIDDLLDVSRISQGKFGLKREHVELTNIVQKNRRDVAPADRAARPRAHRRCTATAGLRRRRRDPAVSGPLQPARQRHQVQRTRGPHRADRRPTRTRRRRDRPRLRDRPRTRRAPQSVRHVRASEGVVR